MLHMLDNKQVKSSLIEISSIFPKDCKSTLEACKLNGNVFWRNYSLVFPHPFYYLF